jgi:HD-GYP domain-containing protein (c-di-GMP phosphodiesterase class II)
MDENDMRNQFKSKLEEWLERPDVSLAVFLALLPVCYLLELYDAEPFISTALFLVTGIMEGIALWKRSYYYLLPMSLGVTVLQFGFVGNGPQAHWHWIAIQLMVHFTTALLARETVKHFLQAGQNGVDMILALGKSLDSRDPYTAYHSSNVADYAVQLATAMALPRKSIEAIYIGGLLHDIGKIGIPESILTKPARLSEQEYQTIKQHPARGYEILKHIPRFKHNGVLHMVLHHHERYDGKGYPQGLKADEIPLFARIMAVADSFDAMVSKRVYRTHDTNIDFALAEMKKGSGTQFDPELAAIFISMIEKEQLVVPIKKAAEAV